MSLDQEYHIERIGYQLATQTIIENHYLHRKAPITWAFGLFDSQESLVGVITYGVPASSTLLKGVCGPQESGNVYELNRLWVDDSVPKNGESFLIGNTIRRVDREIIISYADTAQEHIGVVYQATNWIYTGLSARFRDPKVRGLEHQHHATFANGLTNKEVQEKYGDRVYWIDRPRKHRYVFFNASKTRRRSLIKKLRYPILPYPKITNITVT